VLIQLFQETSDIGFGFEQVDSQCPGVMCVITAEVFEAVGVDRGTEGNVLCDEAVNDCSPEAGGDHLVSTCRKVGRLSTVIRPNAAQCSPF